ncbi:MAG: M20/M25/M40 family metallo-hydrolase [Elusimicrobia bacterium]|nr:M20/M25/M40 family metallo-hydrolase [Elusimicrobiota bacterium]
MKRNIAVVLLLAGFTALFAWRPAALRRAPCPDGDFMRAGAPAGLPGNILAAADRIETARLKTHIAFLTDPRREGRGLGTRGLDAAAQYLAGRLKAAGIPPAGSSYFQNVPLRSVLPENGSMLLRTGSKTVALKAGRDAVLPPAEPGAISGPLVFAGYAIREPSLGHDDFRGLDVKGKIVIFLAGVPPGAAWQKPELLERYASGRPADRYDARLELLEELGARAGIALEEGLERRIADGKEPPVPFFLAPEAAPSGEPPLARAALTPELLKLLRPGAAGSAVLDIRGRVNSIRSSNVLGKLEGSDPALRAQAVIIGAHMDHLGMPAGVLHPGADDNASGVAALLEIARASAAGPRPKRTLIFAFWTGEEEGKLGSAYYVRRPLWPLAATGVYINLDMIAHPWSAKELRGLAEGAGLKDAQGFLAGLAPEYFAEPGISENRRELAPVLAAAGRGTGMSLHLDWTDGRNGGSDYREFARKDVPFVRFFGSYFPLYHSPGDTLAGLDPGQVRRMARLALSTAWLLADR